MDFLARSKPLSVLLSKIAAEHSKDYSSLAQPTTPALQATVLAFHEHVNGVFEHRKRTFLKTLARVNFFANAGLSFLRGRTKTEIFEYDDVID